MNSPSKAVFAFRLNCQALADLVAAPGGRYLYFDTITVHAIPSYKQWCVMLRDLRDHLWHVYKAHCMGAVEFQQRGAPHLHFLTDKRLPVQELRPWLVAHGWGKIMKFKRVDLLAGKQSKRGFKARVDYMVKYITKGYSARAWDDGRPPSDPDLGWGSFSRRIWTCGARAYKKASQRFTWKSGLSELWRAGAPIFVDLMKRFPAFRDMAFVLRLAMEDVGYLENDPWADLIYTAFQVADERARWRAWVPEAAPA